MLQGFFVQLIKELAAGTEASSVPVMTNVGIDISAKLPQMPFLLVAIQQNRTSNKRSQEGSTSREMIHQQFVGTI